MKINFDNSEIKVFKNYNNLFLIYGWDLLDFRDFGSGWVWWLAWISR